MDLGLGHLVVPTQKEVGCRDPVVLEEFMGT